MHYVAVETDQHPHMHNICHTSAGATVVLHEPPRKILLGGKFEFNCTVEGNSEPVYIFYWYHNDSLIQHSDYWQTGLRIKTVMKSKWSNILVTAAQREDRGEYFCEAIFTTTYERIRSNRYTIQIVDMCSETLTPPYSKDCKFNL